MLRVPCYVLLCHAHILEGLYDLISVESNRLLGKRIDSNRFESIRQNFSSPCAFIRDLTSGKSSSAKRTSGESEVFDPRADSNRLCFKTIRLSLGVLDMSGEEDAGLAKLPDKSKQSIIPLMLALCYVPSTVCSVVLLIER